MQLPPLNLHPRGDFFVQKIAAALKRGFVIAFAAVSALSTNARSSALTPPRSNGKLDGVALEGWPRWFRLQLASAL